MSTSVGTSVNQRNTLVWAIVMGGLIVFALRLLDYFAVYSLVLKYPMTVLMQYIASGILGDVAFTGGIGTTLLGLFIHLVISIVVATVFILAAGRLLVLRRNLILGGLLYGVVVYFVMNFVVTPLSAAPPPDAVLPGLIIEGIIGSAVLIGLPLALIAKRNASGNM